MSAALRKPMTREQFFRWAEVQEGRHEFDGEQPVAMTGGTNNHGRICRNTIVQLALQLRGRPCEAMPAESGGIATIGDTVRYPDVTVTCSPLRGTDRLVPDPIVVFEVVSEGDARTDRVHKMREYHAVASIRRYVLVEQASPVLVCYTRQGEEPWMATSLTIGDTLDLPEVGVKLPVADLFEGVDFGADQDLTAS